MQRVSIVFFLALLAFSVFAVNKLTIEKMINNLLDNLNYLEKSWIYNQYDSTVMADTLKEPGQSAGVVKLHDSQKAIGATTDCNPLYIRINPEIGMIYTVVEAYRNLIASNIKPMAITNNLNFASPLDPNIMGEIVLSINGLKTAALKLNTPIVSGNVSLYNQTNEIPINPTPVIGMVGSNSDINKILSNKFQSTGDIIISIGESLNPLNSPYFLQDQKIIKDTNLFNDLVDIDLDKEILTANTLLELSKNNLIQSCNDISRGGIFMALIKMIQKDYGFIIELPNPLNIFCEYKLGYVITVKEDKVNKILDLLRKKKIKYTNIGLVVKEEIKINSKNLDYFDIINKYLKNFEKIIN